ncbi:ATP-binding protein [Chlamydiales bacterium]|nr:ATP-binding protein [Chlamydiales bacterium]
MEWDEIRLKTERAEKFKTFVENVTKNINDNFRELFGFSSDVTTVLISSSLKNASEDVNFSLLKNTKNNTKEDVRYKILTQISSKYRKTKVYQPKIGTAIPSVDLDTVDESGKGLNKVTRLKDLTLGEMIKQQLIQLKLEECFHRLPSSFLDNFHDTIKKDAMNRLFFSKCIESDQGEEFAVVPKSNSEDFKAMNCVKVLTKYPELKASYHSFYKNVSGMLNLKTSLFLDVIFRWSKPELAKEYNAYSPNGILFYGPPGCGKTHIAKKLAKSTNAEFVEYSSGDQGSSFQHETAKK